MATSARLSASELLDGFRTVSSVLSDHAVALDRLDAGDDWGHIDADVSDEDAEAGIDVDRPGAALAGTDLAATLRSAVAAADGAPDMAHLWDGVRSGAARGASGPAGRGLAELLAGMAEIMCNADHFDAQRLALALELGAERIAAGDDGRHPGSLAAVASASAAGALGAVDDGADLADAMISAADEGLVELESGPTANPDLAERGVVDAAAAGFLLVLDTLASVITGEPLPTPPPDAPLLPTGGVRFVVRCRIEPHEGCGLESANWLESIWYELGDLIDFDGIGPVWRAELVTTLPGAAIEALFEVGRPRELHVGVVADLT